MTIKNIKLENLKQRIIDLHEMETRYLAEVKSVNSIINSDLLSENEINELSQLLDHLRRD